MDENSLSSEHLLSTAGMLQLTSAPDYLSSQNDIEKDVRTATAKTSASSSSEMTTRAYIVNYKQYKVKMKKEKKGLCETALGAGVASVGDLC